ncbi:MAG TPA: Holliday junction branch migration protein RuvA [Geothermobacteraceae bacterium]|nr:Holliday junction branch migration protein RuvA [Geothermobacteraceae bacterium]
MIAQLTGEIAYRSIDHLILDVGGVGYRLMIPLSTFYSLPEQGLVRLQVHTHVKEDTLQLFGFLTLEEKQMFTLLLSVSGVGPKLALNILSNIPVAHLQSALASGDSNQLNNVPGIGKKTAERLILELQEKVRKTFAAEIASHPETVSPSSGTRIEDALSALVNLGYKEQLARKALNSLDLAEGASVEEILKGALRILVK